MSCSSHVAASSRPRALPKSMPLLKPTCFLWARALPVLERQVKITSFALRGASARVSPAALMPGPGETWNLASAQALSRSGLSTSKFVLACFPTCPPPQPRTAGIPIPLRRVYYCFYSCQCTSTHSVSAGTNASTGTAIAANTTAAAGPGLPYLLVSASNYY